MQSSIHSMNKRTHLRRRVLRSVFSWSISLGFGRITRMLDHYCDHTIMNEIFHPKTPQQTTIRDQISILALCPCAVSSRNSIIKNALLANPTTSESLLLSRFTKPRFHILKILLHLVDILNTGSCIKFLSVHHVLRPQTNGKMLLLCSLNS